MTKRYDITPENLIYHTLIGLETVVSDSTNPDMIDIKGVVVDETRNTLVIDPHAGKRFFHRKPSDKIIPKSHTSFIFRLPNGSRVKVNGDLLIARPEDRVAKKHRN